ncbi:MAG: DUF7544 domain-containing protein [Anaerolineae bacterium]
MAYTKILKRAVEITWRYKALWLFGFLLAFSSGGGYGNIGRGVEYRVRSGEQLPLQFALGMVFVAIILVLALVIIGIVLTNISRAALIGMVREIEDTEHTSISNGWRIGWMRLLPLIGLDLAIGIPLLFIAIVLIIMGLSPLALLFAQRRVLTILGILLTVLFMLMVIGLLIVAGALVGLWRDFAYRQCVLEGKGILDSLCSAYHIVRKNLQQVGLLWLLLFGIDLLVGFITVPLSLIIMGMAVAPVGLLYVTTESLAMAILTGILLVTPAVLLLSFLGGIYQVFRSTTWTLAYLQLQSGAHSAEIDFLLSQAQLHK